MAKRKASIQSAEEADEIREFTAKVVKPPGKYRVLRGLSLDGPAYGDQKWRFEPGDRSDLEMIKPHMIKQLIKKGVIEEARDG